MEKLKLDPSNFVKMGYMKVNGGKARKSVWAKESSIGQMDQLTKAGGIMTYRMDRAVTFTPPSQSTKVSGKMVFTMAKGHLQEKMKHT